MRRSWRRNPHVELGLVFVLLVLLPSFLLGSFSLRAVESQRAAAQQRSLAERSSTADLAGRIVHQEMKTLEAGWSTLVPRHVGWEANLGAVVAALDSARGRDFVRACHLLHVSGQRLYPPEPAATDPTPIPSADAFDAGDAHEVRELLAAAETAEFELDTPAAALVAYRALLDAARTPRLQAVAHAGIARAQLHLQQWQRAIEASEWILQQYADAYDLDNQPLRLQARLHIARAREEMGQALPAASALVASYEDLVAHSDEIGRLQFDVLVERIEERMARLLPRPVPGDWRELEQRYAAVAAQRKRPIGSEYFANKLSRKLVRAALEGLVYTTEVRYLSATVDGEPFLLAYVYLPDASGTAVAALAGFEIDLMTMSNAMLPGIMQQFQANDDLVLALVDAEGKPVLSGSAVPATNRVSHPLAVPFDFWSVAVALEPDAEDFGGLEFRTKVYLYLVLVLLLTIGTGAALVVIGLRRQSRLANMKTSLVSSVSHELRTPLTSIRLFSELLEAAGEDASLEQRRQYLHTIRREVDRLQRLIDQVLDFARGARGARQFRFEFEEIGDLVRNVAEDFRSQAEGNGFRFEVDIEPDLPEVRVDADALRQLLLNLLANAMQYSEKERAITVRARRSGLEICIQVQDRGIGIDPTDHERIFEDFYRGDTRLSSRHGGLGLGLALVRRIATAHGGRVTVDSRRGQGAVFTIWLPVSEDGGTESAGKEARRARS